MTFGSEETFALIGDTLRQGDKEAYGPLCKILYGDVEIYFNKYCSSIRNKEDREELIQDAVRKAVVGLPKFYINSKDYTVAERNAWLRTIVIRIKIDYFRKIFSPGEIEAESIDIKERTDRRDYIKQIEQRELLFDILKSVFSFKTTADKLMAFVYNRLLFSLSGKNGSPKIIIEEFDGVSWIEMYKQLVEDLSNALQCEIPESVLAPLKTKIDDNPQRTFNLSAHTIADSSSDIMQKAKEQHSNEQYE